MTSKPHKGATEIALIAHQEPSLFNLWVRRYWKLGLAAFVAIAAMILIRQYLQAQGEAARRGQWETLQSAITINPFSAEISGDEAKVRQAVDELEGTPVEPWAVLSLVHAALEKNDYAAAREAIARLRATHESSLTSDRFALTDEADARPLTDWLEARVQAQEEWEAAHSGLMSNPPPPADAPRVKIVTGAGDIVVALYQTEAPKHVENFLKLCGEGYYDGIKFHRVMQDFMIQAGDPNSREADFEKWGQGGPGYTVPFERNQLYHFRGVLSAAKLPSEADSSGSQFFITTGAPHHLDGRHVVYGAVVEGMEVVEEIAAGEIEDPQTARPERPVEIVRTEVL